ncbi:MAG: metallophosphoesterase family protein, partial [Actinobacteria bacterium]
ASVAVIADTHLPRGGRRLADECVRILEGAELIVHAGDFVAASVLEELRALGRVEAVYGNMDEPSLRESLPKELVVEVEGMRIGIVHVPGPAAGREARLAARFPGCEAVVYGHTHVPQVERFGEAWILNPGSPTERRRAPVHSMLVLEVEDGEIRPELVTLS